MLTAWESRPNTDTTTGVLHFGFECPATDDIESTASRFPGDLLLTESAKHGLPASLASTTGVVGKVGNLSLHRIVGGWHAASARPSHDQLPVATAKARPPVAFDHQWLDDAIRAHPAIRQTLLNASIHDDLSYYSRESTLDHDARILLGQFRAEALGSSVVADPCKLAKAASPWLIEMPLDALSFSVRARNIFSYMNLNTVRDLAGLTRDDLFNQRNFGITTCKVVTQALRIAIKEGPPRNSKETPRPSIDDGQDDDMHTLPNDIRPTLVSEIWYCLQLLPAQEATILARRIGFMAEIQTLAQLGQTFQLTRERIRQICVKAIDKITHDGDWYNRLCTKISEMKVDTVRPLDLALTESLDPWFNRCSEYSTMIGGIINQMKNPSIRLIQIDETAYFANISQDTWDNVVKKAHALMHSLATNRAATKEECQTRISAILPDAGREFDELLWASISDLCRFSEDPNCDNNDRVLRRSGDNAETFVRAVLQSSEQPIHVREIARRVTELSGRKANIGTIHNIAYQCGLLFGRGTYGANHHFPLSDVQVERICEITEDIVADSPSKTRWHTIEILEGLLEIDGVESFNLNKYLLNIALHSCSSLKHVKRMYWRSSDSERIDSKSVSDENRIIAILRESGCPLATIDIKAKLRETSGVNEYFQILPTRNLIQVGRRMWGLNDRDVPVPLSEQQDLLNRLASVLAKKQSGLHISEVTAAVDSREFPAEGLFSLAMLDDRFNTAIGRYVYLASWGEPRRESLQEAVKSVLNGKQAMTIRELLSAVEERLDRSIMIERLRSTLHALDAQYDKSTGTWSYPEFNQVDEL